MAAAEVLVFTESWKESAPVSTTRRYVTGLDERWLRARLSIIAKAWVASRRHCEVSLSYGAHLFCFLAFVLAWIQALAGLLSRHPPSPRIPGFCATTSRAEPPLGRPLLPLLLESRGCSRSLGPSAFGHLNPAP